MYGGCATTSYNVVHYFPSIIYVHYNHGTHIRQEAVCEAAAQCFNDVNDSTGTFLVYVWRDPHLLEVEQLVLVLYLS
ncbi:hypothetical protein AB1N83_009962 [Pleurotus pulmonarius]